MVTATIVSGQAKEEKLKKNFVVVVDACVVVAVNLVLLLLLFQCCFCYCLSVWRYWLFCCWYDCFFCRYCSTCLLRLFCIVLAYLLFLPFNLYLPSFFTPCRRTFVASPTHLLLPFPSYTSAPFLCTYLFTLFANLFLSLPPPYSSSLPEAPSSLSHSFSFSFFLSLLPLIPPFSFFIGSLLSLVVFLHVSFLLTVPGAAHRHSKIMFMFLYLISSTHMSFVLIPTFPFVLAVHVMSSFIFIHLIALLLLLLPTSTTTHHHPSPCTLHPGRQPPNVALVAISGRGTCVIDYHPSLADSCSLQDLAPHSLTHSPLLHDTHSSILVWTHSTLSRVCISLLMLS